jgi:hypothetical protein
MFIENYRLENMVGGQALWVVPYPEISAEDWKAWQAFLPVRTDYKLGDASKPRLIRRLGMLGVPTEAAQQIVEARRHFQEIEIWGKRNLYKDPIAVGLLDERRYLICRWGMDRLVPFETIKRRSGMYHAWNLLVSAVNNEVFVGATGMLTFWGSIVTVWVILSLLASVK